MGEITITVDPESFKKLLALSEDMDAYQDSERQWTIDDLAAQGEIAIEMAKIIGCLKTSIE
jgi:hypothetical protein